MAENKNSELTKKQLKEELPENLRTKYNSLAAYNNSVVTFRFTTLGFFLAAVGLILGGTPSLGKYIILTLIIFSLYIIELRNRFLKNENDAQANQIEKMWGYVQDDEPALTTIFGLVICEKDRKKSRQSTNM
jgi:hypothetical protein